MKVAVLLSGGVDSSVALHLLQQQGGVDVTAFYLKIWLEDELAAIGDCPWETDLQYVRAVCEQEKVPLEVVSLQSEYYAKVVEYALAELRAGRTPSPDIFCNQRIKFGEFFAKIDRSFAKVATGHYAGIDEIDGCCYLRRSPDPVKDQTYFLSHLRQEQLQRAVFPLAPYTKKQVRKLAQQFALPTKDRKDSQGICFLGKINYPDFVKFHLGERPGAIVDLESGKMLGEHRGYWFYTIGQRQGLGLGNGPWFVTQKDVRQNIIFVTHKSRLEAHMQHAFTVAAVNWIVREPAATPLQVKLRHGPELIPCTLEQQIGGRYRVQMARSDAGIAPGQFAVFYRGAHCLGGGVIEI